MRNESEKKILAIAAVYAISMLLVCSLAVWFISRREASPAEVCERITEIHTELVYVPVSGNAGERESQTVDDTDIPTWTVREYEGRIGVFSDDGTLCRVVDVYVKTLPETDRRLLGEGIRITGEEKLRAILEDYSD